MCSSGGTTEHNPNNNNNIQTHVVRSSSYHSNHSASMSATMPTNPALSHHRNMYYSFPQGFYPSSNTSRSNTTSAMPHSRSDSFQNPSFDFDPRRYFLPARPQAHTLDLNTAENRDNFHNFVLAGIHQHLYLVNNNVTPGMDTFKSEDGKQDSCESESNQYQNPILAMDNNDASYTLPGCTCTYTSSTSKAHSNSLSASAKNSAKAASLAASKLSSKLDPMYSRGKLKWPTLQRYPGCAVPRPPQATDSLLPQHVNIDYVKPQKNSSHSHKQTRNNNLHKKLALSQSEERICSASETEADLLNRASSSTKYHIATYQTDHDAASSGLGDLSTLSSSQDSDLCSCGQLGLNHSHTNCSNLGTRGSTEVPSDVSSYDSNVYRSQSPTEMGYTQNDGKGPPSCYDQTSRGGSMLNKSVAPPLNHNVHDLPPVSHSQRLLSFLQSAAESAAAAPSEPAGNSHPVQGNSYFSQGNSHLPKGNSHSLQENSHSLLGNSHLLQGNSHTLQENSNIEAFNVLKDSLDDKQVKQVFHTFSQDNLNNASHNNTELPSDTTNCYVQNYQLPRVWERRPFPKTTNADHTADICKPKCYNTSIKKKCDKRDQLYVFDLPLLPESANVQCDNYTSDHTGVNGALDKTSKAQSGNSPRNSDISVSSNDTSGLSPFVSDWYQSSGSDSNPEPNPMGVCTVPGCKPFELRDYIRNGLNVEHPDELPVIPCDCEGDTSPVMSRDYQADNSVHTQTNSKTASIETKQETGLPSLQPLSPKMDFKVRNVPSSFTPAPFTPPSSAQHLPFTLQSPPVPQPTHPQSPTMSNPPMAGNLSHIQTQAPTLGQSCFNFNYQMLLKRKCSHGDNEGVCRICESCDNPRDMHSADEFNSATPPSPPLRVPGYSIELPRAGSPLQHSCKVPAHVPLGRPYPGTSCSTSYPSATYTSSAMYEYGSLSSIVAGTDLQIEYSTVPTGAGDEMADLAGIHSSDGLSQHSPNSSMDGVTLSSLHGPNSSMDMGCVSNRHTHDSTTDAVSPPFLQGFSEAIHTRGIVEAIPCAVGSDGPAQSCGIIPGTLQPPQPPSRDTIVFTSPQGMEISKGL